MLPSGTHHECMSESPPLPLWEIVQTSRVVERRLTAVFAQAGLSPAQFGVLACVADGDDLSQADLARAILVRPQSLAPLLAGLVERGLLDRDGEPARGRRSTYALTAEGRAALDLARPEVARINSPEATGLSPADIQRLVDMLRLLRLEPDGDG